MAAKNNAALVDKRFCKVESQLLVAMPGPPLTSTVKLAARGTFEHHPNGFVIYFVKITVTGIDANNVPVWKGRGTICLSFRVDDPSIITNRGSREFVVLNHTELDKLIKEQATKFQYHIVQLLAPEDPLFV